MKIGIVLPTVTGREAIFDRVLCAFEETVPDGWEFDVTVPEGYATVGEAWNAGAGDVDGDYLFFAIDDAEPHPGWAEIGTQTADAGFIPAPRQEFADGTLESCGSMGFGQLLGEAPDCTPCRNAGIIFIRREWWAVIGPFLPIHYGCDDDWNWRAALHGHPLLYRSGMRFTHHHERAATFHVRDAAAEHHEAVLEHARTLKLPGKPAAALECAPQL